MIEVRAGFGWDNTLVIANSTTEVIITLDVGPRVISYRRLQGDNVFHTEAAELGAMGEESFRLRGGHRLWMAPESAATYHPDNQPVIFETSSDYSATISAPPETSNHLEKTLHVSLDPNTSDVNVTHTIRALSDRPAPVSVWAITVMRAGGVASIPMPPRGVHPDESDSPGSPSDYLPDRHLSLWRYTDPGDSRFHWRGDQLLIHQRDAPATKIGFLNRLGSVSYQLEADTFTKSVPLDEAGNYPDGGCNLEVFTNASMLELETLSPLKRLRAGDELVHRESWQLS